MRIGCFALVLLLAAGCGSTIKPAGGAPEERNHVWKVQSIYPRTLAGMGPIPVTLAERLQAATGGSITCKVADPGAYVNGPEILDAVSSGGIQAGFAAAGFWQGKLPAAPLFTSIPFGPNAGEYLAWLYQGNGMKLYQRMYDQAGYQVKVLVAGISAPESSGWFRKEINSPADLQGLKMRFFGLGGDVMQQLGVAVSKQSPAELCEALERGVIDATEFATPAADLDRGFHKSASFNYFPGWHQQATVLELLIHRPAWDALSPQQQAALELACSASATESMALSESLQGPALRVQAEQNQVQVRRWSQEMLTLFADTWQQVAAKHAADDAYFKEVWEDLCAFRAAYAPWRDHGYLR